MPTVDGAKHQAVKKSQPPKLVNRGPAGLLNKVRTDNKPSQSVRTNDAGPLNRVAPALKALMVPIDSLKPDPNNARVHPDRNMESIRESLKLYGQLKPIVVRLSNRVIVAGNGTWQAAKDLGWTEIAANLVEMSDVESAGYGLADNRTAELAKWDFEVVARIDKLLQEANHSSVGWTMDELEVLRAADWAPPPVEDTQFGTGNGDGQEGGLVVSFNPDQFDSIKTAITKHQENAGDPDLSVDDCLVAICQEWLEIQDA